MNIETLSALSDEELRVILGELLYVRDEKSGLLEKRDPDNQSLRRLNFNFPHFCSDLNEAAKVEAGLTDEQYEHFSNDLWNVVNPGEIRQPSHPVRLERAFISSQPRQRVIALILALTP